MSNLLRSLVLASVFVLPAAHADQKGSKNEFTPLRVYAQTGLRENLNPLRDGTYVSAGAHQFKGLWTRDFAYATRGLFEIGRADVVKDHVELILRNMRAEDHLVPRYLDSVNTAARYYQLILFGKVPPLTNDLIPNYLGGGTKGQAADSNLLTIHSALDVLDRTGDAAWWAANEAALIRAFRYYDAWKDADGLVTQLEASDWQDSVLGRKGKTFYVNVLWAAANLRLAAHPAMAAAFGVSSAEAEYIRTTVLTKFKDPKTKLYLSILGHPYVSLDGILLALDLGVIDPKSELGRETWNNLKFSEFWTRNPGIPGFNTFPDYPKDWIETSPKLSGLRNYHDSIYWSWLMGFAAKTAYTMGDRTRGDIILRQMQEIAVRDGGVSEIYRQKPPYERFETLVFKSERPFSWGIGFVLDALKAREQTR